MHKVKFLPRNAGHIPYPASPCLLSLPAALLSYLFPQGSHRCCVNMMLVQGSHREDKEARRMWLAGCRVPTDPG